MPLVRLNPNPGIQAQQTQTANSNGWWACNLVRWRLGLLEKIGGWARLIEDQCVGFIRRLHSWEDLSNNKDLLIASDGGVQVLINDTLSSRLSVAGKTLSGGAASTSLVTFSVTIASNQVTANVPDTFNASVGETFTFNMPISIGGRILDIPARGGSTYTITTVGVGSFTFNMASNALYTESSVVGLPLLTFTWASNLATVTFRNHGKVAGQTFPIDLMTSFVVVGRGSGEGITIPAGTNLLIVTTPTVDTFTFDWTSFGTATSADPTLNIYEGSNQDALGNTTFGIVLLFSAASAALRPGVQSWYLDNLGENGLVLYESSPLYVYQPSQGLLLSRVGGDTDPATAPQISNGMFVAMPQAQVIVFGTEAVLGSGTIDPLLLRFSDAGSYTDWTATVSNQAGSYRLSKGSMIIGGIQSPQTTMIFTDTDVWSMSYQGPPLVYGFTIMGTGCGLLAPHAVTVLGRTTYWLGQNNFWSFGESGVRPLPCPVWDIIFTDLDTDSINLAFAGSNSSCNEVMFFYPSLADKPATPVNLLAYSQDLSNLIWVKDDVSITEGFTAPDSSTTAEKLVEDSSVSGHDVFQALSKAAESIALTISVYAHKNSTRWGYLYLGSASGNASVIFNPITGVIVSSAANGPSWSITLTAASTDTLATGIAGNGWLRYSMQVVTDNSAGIVAIVGNVNQATSATYYLGNGTAGLICWGAQVNLGALVAYSMTTASSINNPTRYIKYNVAEGLWDYGRLERTAWLNDSIFGEGTPLAGDANFRIQHHEDGFDDDGSPMRDVFAETGYGTVSDGSVIMSIDQCQPDLKWFGNDGSVNLTIKTVAYPGGPQQSYGPYPITPTTQYFSVRARTKQAALRYDWAPVQGFSARIGATAFRVKPAGSRP